MTRVLGFDPGLATAGFGVVESASGRVRLVECGQFSTPSSDRIETRLSTIFHRLTEAIARHEPDAVSVEQQIYRKNVRTAMALGQVQGVAMLAAAEAGIPAAAYTPLDIKVAVVGNGKADKAQVSRMVAMLLGCPADYGEHAGDALAAAICHLHAHKMQRLLAEGYRRA